VIPWYVAGHVTGFDLGGASANLPAVRALIVHAGDGREIRPRGALTAARALAVAGWTVGIGSPQRDFVSASRWSRHWHRVPSSWEGDKGFIEGTRGAVTEQNYDVVFGTADADVLALTAHRDEIGALIAHPSYQRSLMAIDKLQLAAAAQRAGLQTPRIVEGNADDAEVVVKPRISKLPGLAMTFSDRGQSARRIVELSEAGAESVVQERVRGRLMAFTVVANRESRVVARVQQEARAIFPPEAGVSARAETVPIDEALAAKVSQLVHEVGWFGLAELQFLVPNNARPVLIDFNGRFYGSLALAVAAGVNLPAIWACVATGRPLPPTREASPGVRYQWLEGDLRRARAEQRGGLARDLADSLRYFPGAAHNIWSATDPMPALRVLHSVVSCSLSFRVRAFRRQLGPARPTR
jgi:predicted ATP-grasp superfamily ATP-dependent carboligase